ncbi:MAG: hypothetical protein LBQ82_02525 [Treponema sp.]|jgi:chromosome segregation ATPase|nr:hypothetical protein [Treponema sp.]
MTETKDIVFDEKSGISIEEQKEILSRINGITDKNRISLSHNIVDVKPGKNPVVNAKKSGSLFPLIVNLSALAILAVGGFLLVSFNGKKDAQVRTGNAVYDITERALIEEIRKDTSQKLASKEMEIASINSRLENVDAELARLYSSNKELTAEQRAAQERLLAMQNAYRGDLAALQDERSQILEDSRSREAKLRAQLEERAREFAAAEQRTTGELDSAIAELNRLTNEQERIAAIDAQLSGALAAAAGFIQNEQYDQAAQTVENMRHLINSVPLSTRSFQSARGFYNQAINSMEAAITQLRKNSGVDSGKESWDLQLENDGLKNRIAELQKTISAFNSGSSGQALRLSELETSVASLQSTASELQTDKTVLSQRVSDLQTANSDQEREIMALRSQLAIIRQAAQE